MDDQVCPRCKTTRYRNPSLKLLVNVCGHSLCENCVELLFIKGSGNCPQCNIPLRRTNFRLQLFEDSTVEKDIDIRKRILRDYNKKEEDFSCLEEYNNYLEEVETIIYNLVHDIDTFEMNKKIEQYKKENKEFILKNKIKISKEEAELEELLEEEKEIKIMKQKEAKQLELDEKMKKIQQKEALIDELMFSDTNAKNIIDQFKQQSAVSSKAKIDEISSSKPAQGKVTQFSSGVKFSQKSAQSFLPLPKVEEGPLYSYEPLEFSYNGPPPPSWEELSRRGYLNNVTEESLEEHASGWQVNLYCMKALQEAFSGLFYVPTKKSD